MKKVKKIMKFFIDKFIESLEVDTNSLTNEFLRVTYLFFIVSLAVAILYAAIVIY